MLPLLFLGKNDLLYEKQSIEICWNMAYLMDLIGFSFIEQWIGFDL